MAQPTPSSSSWQGTLSDLANIVNTIRRSRAFGRLTLRSSTHFAVAHFYFRAGKLVHIVGSRGNAYATLSDLEDWTQASIRFERGTAIPRESISDEQEQMFDGLLLQLQRRGIVVTPKTPRIIEGGLVASSQAEPLLTPEEWRILVEATGRVSQAVAHLVGPREAMNVLRDILDDCSAAFPAFSGLQIASSGFLQVADTSKLDRMPRREVLEGFTALIATCEYFCSPIIGEEDAHRLIIRALGDVAPVLVSLGILQ